MSVQTQRCDSAEEAARVISSNPKSRLLGGGTLVMRAVNEGDQSFDTVVHLNDPRMQELRIEGDRLVIGAGVTMRQLLASNDAGFLHQAARLVGGPAVRNMATVGGNLFAHHPYGDVAVALLALDAEVTLAGSNDTQTLEALLNNRESLRTQSSGPSGAAPRAGGPSAVISSQIVTSIRCKRPSSPDDFRFLKISRVKPKGISVMCIAAHLPNSSSAITGARVVWGAMAPTPVRSTAIEGVLEGKRLDESSVQAAMAVATDGLRPPQDALASSWYRSAVAPVHLGRMLRGGRS